MRGSARLFLFALWIALISAVSAGCSREAMPELITLDDVVPREVEVGDKLEISGTGLPEGRTARVTFRGALHRPGEPAIENAEIVTKGEVTSRERVEIAYDEALEATFCGAGNRATHTTFDGTIEVAFAATLVGAPPVAASLAHASIDFRPPLAAASEATREGERLVAFAGLHLVDADSRGAGLGVASVDAGSRAEGAGLQDGDEIVSFDGVRVLSVADLGVVEGARSASVVVRRAGRNQTLTLHLEGFRPAPLADRFALLVALVVVLGIVALRARPVAISIVTLARRAQARRLALWRAPMKGWSEKLGVLPSALVLAVALLAAPLAVEAAPRRIDVPSLFGAMALASVLVAAIARGLRDAIRVLGFQLAAAAATAASVMLSGSVRAGEIVAMQPFAPWEWVALRGPAGLAAASLLVGATLASTLRPTTERDLASMLEVRATRQHLDTGDAIRVALACSLVVTLFVGHSSPTAPRALGVMIALGEGFALFSAIAAARVVVPGEWRVRDFLLGAAVVLGLAFAQTALGLDRRMQDIVDLGTLAALAFVAVHFLTIFRAAGRPNGTIHLRPSPFL